MGRLRRLAALAGVLVVALGSLVLLSATSAFACSCVRRDAAQRSPAAGEVFVGTITHTERASGGLLARGGGSIDWTVDVDRVWKGAVPATVTVSSSSQSTACGVGDLPQGRPVLFFVSPDAADSASARHVNSCGGTAVLRADVEEQVTAALGPPHAPAAASDGSSGTKEPSVDDGTDDRASRLHVVWSEVGVTVAAVAGVVGLIGAAVWLGLRLGRRRG